MDGQPTNYSYSHELQAQRVMSLKLVEGNPLMKRAATATQSGRKATGLAEQRRKRELEEERQKVVDAYRRLRGRVRMILSEAQK